jgi:hypothetical protein
MTAASKSRDAAKLFLHDVLTLRSTHSFGGEEREVDRNT